MHVMKSKSGNNVAPDRWGSVNYGWQAKSGPLPVFVSNLLLDQSHAY